MLPDGTEPFASYGPRQGPGRRLFNRGKTYEHTSEVAGRYTDVCIPHADAEMMGTIRVEYRVPGPSR